jgi:hypothetical protein
LDVSRDYDHDDDSNDEESNCSCSSTDKYPSSTVPETGMEAKTSTLQNGDNNLTDLGFKLDDGGTVVPQIDGEDEESNCSCSSTGKFPSSTDPETGDLVDVESKNDLGFELDDDGATRSSLCDFNLNNNSILESSHEEESHEGTILETSFQSSFASESAADMTNPFSLNEFMQGYCHSKMQNQSDSNLLEINSAASDEEENNLSASDEEENNPSALDLIESARRKNLMNSFSSMGLNSTDVNYNTFCNNLCPTNQMMNDSNMTFASQLSDTLWNDQETKCAKCDKENITSEPLRIPKSSSGLKVVENVIERNVESQVDQNSILNDDKNLANLQNTPNLSVMLDMSHDGTKWNDQKHSSFTTDTAISDISVADEYIDNMLESHYALPTPDRSKLRSKVDTTKIREESSSSTVKKGLPPPSPARTQENSTRKYPAPAFVKSKVSTNGKYDVPKLTPSNSFESLGKIPSGVNEKEVVDCTFSSISRPTSPVPESQKSSKIPFSSESFDSISSVGILSDTSTTSSIKDQLSLLKLSMKSNREASKRHTRASNSFKKATSPL